MVRTLVIALCLTSWGSLAQGGEAKPDAGIAFLEARLQRDPDDFIAANQLAERFFRRARAEGRIEDLRRVERVVAQSLKAMPAEQNGAGAAARIRVALAMHRFAEARDLARQLCASTPGKPLPLQLLGDAQMELGELDAAEKQFKEVEQQTGDHYGMSARFARLAWLRGRVEEAQKHLDRAVELARKDGSPDAIAWCLIQRGEHAFRRGDWERAETVYVEALSLVPNQWSALEHMAELRGAQGRDKEAQELFERVASATDRPEVWQSLGDLHAFYKRADEAKKAHSRAKEGYLKSVESGEILYVHHLAGFYAESDVNGAEAVKWARKDLEGRDTPAAQDALAWALFRDEKILEALAAAKKAIAGGTSDPHILYHAAKIHMAVGVEEEAQKLFRRCKEINPRHDAFHVHR